MTTLAKKRAALNKCGLIIGERDHRLNTNYQGLYMICEPYDESELPTPDGRNGPWCIVGDSLIDLIHEAFEHYPLKLDRT